MGPGWGPWPPRLARLSVSLPAAHRSRCLERAGYIRRLPDPSDRRRQVVHATEATAARDQEVFGDLIHRTSKLLATYSDDQLQVIHDFLDRTRQLTADYTDTLGGDHTAASTPSGP